MQFQMRHHFDDGGDKDSLLTVLFENIRLVVDVDFDWLCSQFSKQLRVTWTQYSLAFVLLENKNQELFRTISLDSLGVFDR